MEEESGPRLVPRPRTAYQLFLQEARAHTRSSRGFLSEAAQQWANLSTSERHVFIERAEREREAMGPALAPTGAARRPARRLSAATFQELLRNEPRLLGSLTTDATAFLGEVVHSFASNLLQRVHTQAIKAGKTKLTPEELLELGRGNIQFAFLQDLPREEDNRASAGSVGRPAPRSLASAGGGTLDAFFPR